MPSLSQTELTPSKLDLRLSGFRGGEIEVQNQGEGFVNRGIIESAGIKGGDLEVRVSRFARMTSPGVWVEADTKRYKASLEIFGVSEIGNGRLCFQSRITEERTVLYPPNGSKLDWSRVQPAEGA